MQKKHSSSPNVRKIKKGAILPATCLIITIVSAVFFFKKEAYASTVNDENSMLVDEFKKVVPDIRNGRKSLSVFQGERAIQSEIRDIRFGGDYFVVQDSVWNGRAISVRKMFIKSSEILWLLEDETSIVLRLKN